MTLRQILRDFLYPEYERPDLFDQHFGLGLFDDDILHSGPLQQHSSRYVRPWRRLGSGDFGVSSVRSNQNEFRVNVDVQQFHPNELKVKIENGFLVVDGKHDERSDEHGFISRQFTRRYKIPEDVDEGALVSSLSSDGVLTLKAPKRISSEISGREIPITFSSEPAVKEKGKQTTEPAQQ